MSARQPLQDPSEKAADAEHGPKTRVLSRWPFGFLVVAAAIVVGYAICHAAGLREGVGTLTGTASYAANPLLALLYVGLYLGTVVLAPILAMAAVLFVVAQRVLSLGRRR